MRQRRGANAGACLGPGRILLRAAVTLIASAWLSLLAVEPVGGAEEHWAVSDRLAYLSGTGPLASAQSGTWGSQWSLYVAGEDGSHPRRLADNVHAGSPPAPSPNGAWIGFNSARDGLSIVTVGSGQVRTLREQSPFAMSWAPGGDRLAFAATRNGVRQVSLVAVDGSRRVQVTHGAGPKRYPAWSPDGRWIAYVTGVPSTSVRWNHELWIVSPDGSGSRRVADGVSDVTPPVWSPDGRRIAFASRNGLEVSQIDGGNPVIVAEQLDEPTALSWAPHGRDIAFQARDLFVGSLDGQPPRKLAGSERGGFIITYPLTYYWPAWSPDGKWIAFVRSDLAKDRHELMKITVDGRTQVRLAADGERKRYPVWLPMRRLGAD